MQSVHEQFDDERLVMAAQAVERKIIREVSGYINRQWRGPLGLRYTPQEIEKMAYEKEEVVSLMQGARSIFGRLLKGRTDLPTRLTEFASFIGLELNETNNGTLTD